MKTRYILGNASRLGVLGCLGIAVAALPSLTYAGTAGSEGQAENSILLAAGSAISVPETVDRGQPVGVRLSGAAAGHRLELWGPKTERDPGELVARFEIEGETVVIAAPRTAGSYELRHVGAGDAILARTDLEVSAGTVTLTVPSAVGAGYDAEIRWIGPGAPGDMIQFYDPATGRVVSETPAVSAGGETNVAVLSAPEGFDTYHLRYWSGRGQSVLSTLPVEVGDGTAWLRTPIEVPAGSAFLAEWDGPLAPAQFYEIVDARDGSVVATHRADGEGSARLTAPERPGDYRVRLVNRETGFVLADLPLDVDPN